MTHTALRRLGALLGPAVVVALGCGETSTSDDPGTGSGSAGTGTGTTGPGCGAVQLTDVADGIGGFVLVGETPSDRSAYEVSGAGDVNGDGLADVIVGAFYAGPDGLSQSGRAYVVFGKANTEAISLADVAAGAGGFVLDGEPEGYAAGISVSTVGDMNGDGLSDVVVGASWASPNDVTGSGRAYVVFGKADTGSVALADVADGVGGFVLDGEVAGAQSGATVSGAGDLNGDGIPEVIVWARYADPNDLHASGRTYVVFGKDTAPVLLADVAGGIGGFVLDGEAEYDYAGRNVGGAGDINGDGLADLVVAAHFADPSDLRSAGRTYVVFGKADTAPLLLADVAGGVGGFVVDGEIRGEQSGFSASGAGDVNGDGIPDVLLGAPGAAPNGSWRVGRGYVVFGKANTDPVQLADVAQGVGGFAMDGENLRTVVGHAVSGAGDVNGDGLADVIVAGWRADTNGSQAGRTYVVFGKTDTDRVLLEDVTLRVGGFALDGEGEHDQSGRSVSGPGDVNGDGLADILVGASGAAPGRAYVVFGGDFSCGE